MRRISIFAIICAIILTVTTVYSDRKNHDYSENGLVVESINGNIVNGACVSTQSGYTQSQSKTYAIGNSSGETSNGEVKKAVTKEPVVDNNVSEDCAVKKNDNVESNEAAFKNDFSNAVFVGNSIPAGLGDYNILPEAGFCSYQSLVVKDIDKKKVIKLEDGSKGTIIDGLKQKQYERVYIMFGTNELGWIYDSVFEKEYKIMLDKVRAVQPNATIYCQAVFPLGRKGIDGIVNNEHVVKLNVIIEKIAKEYDNACYLDVYTPMKDSEGYLFDEASSDGVHPNKKYCKKWVEILRELR